MLLNDLKTRATITVPEAAELLGVSRDNAYMAAKDGTLPVLRLGHRVLISAPALLKLLHGQDTHN